MKRTFAALLLTVGLVPGPVLGQASIVSQIAGGKAATEKLYFSLTFGMNVSYLKGAEGAGRTGGFNAGLTATIRLSERLSLVPGITLFSRKGLAEIPFTPTGDPALDLYFAELEASDLALEYIDLPILVTYRLGRFHVGAGPYVSLLGAATERFRADLDSGMDVRLRRNVIDQYKKADFGLVAEGSWTITKPRRGVGLILHVRCQEGLTHVLKIPTEPVLFSPSGSLRTSVFQLYLSFPFVY
jgi:hypothetical protein